MRTLLLLLLVAPATAAAQLGLPMPTPPPPMSGVPAPDPSVTQDAVDRAVASAMAETLTAVQDSATVEVLEAIQEAFEGPSVAAVEARAATSEPRAPRARRMSGAQSFPILIEGYGYEGDGFPVQSIIRGTVESAGSMRLCREGRPPVSRWIRVRLSGTPDDAPPVHVVVAVQCDEWAAEHYIGRRVTIDAIKSMPEQDIRMARRDVPPSDAPIYLTDPTRLRVE